MLGRMKFVAAVLGARLRADGRAWQRRAGMEAVTSRGSRVGKREAGAPHGWLLEHIQCSQAQLAAGQSCSCLGAKCRTPCDARIAQLCLSQQQKCVVVLFFKL